LGDLRLGRPADAAALLDWPKTHDADRGGWTVWFASQGVEDPGSARGSPFDDPGLGADVRERVSV